jgi:hypothetical protein
MRKNKSKNGWTNEISEEGIEFTQPDVMLKLISTIDDRGWPHVTLISSNRAISKDRIVWGAFTEGLSKRYVRERPKQGVFYMTAAMPFKFLQAEVDFTHTSKEGPDLEHFNQTQLMRYFTYVRTHTAYYNNIVAATPVKNLPLFGIVKGIIKNIIGKGGAKTKLDDKRLNVIGHKLFAAPIAVRVISYIDPSDGYPTMIPAIQLQAADRNRLVFPPSVLKEDLLRIPVNSKVAVFGMNFDFYNQVVKGTFAGFKKFRGIKFGVIEIEEVYNSTPPVARVIYPRVESVPKVTDFHL